MNAHRSVGPFCMEMTVGIASKVTKRQRTSNEII